MEYFGKKNNFDKRLGKRFVKKSFVLEKVEKCGDFVKRFVLENGKEKRGFVKDLF